MQNDGLFIIPYTSHDWIVLTIAVLGTIFRLYLVSNNKDSKQRMTVADYLNALVISGILTIGLYEMAIYNRWKIEQLYLPFAVIIISSKIIVDWLFMSDDGKMFIISTFKMMVESTLKKLGYEKTTTDTNNPQ